MNHDGGNLRVLFVGEQCLFDSASGAAIATRSLLEALVRMGATCEAVMGSHFDGDVPLAQALARHGLRSRGDAFRRKGVRFTIVRARGGRPFTEELVGPVRERFEALRANVILTMSGSPSLREVCSLGRRMGAAVVVYLHNLAFAHQPAREALDFADAVWVPSQFSVRRHERAFDIRCDVLRPTFALPRCIVQRRQPRFVTYVNPAFHKGLRLFDRIASECIRRLPEVRFLVVEGLFSSKELARWAPPLARLPNIRTVANCADMRRIYARTRVLLYPSLCEETFGLCAAEALGNGIPVIASDRGALPEVTRGAQLLVTPPKRCVQDPFAAPHASDADPWLAHLSPLLLDWRAYHDASMRAKAAARSFDPAGDTHRAVALLQRLIGGARARG